MGMTDTLIARMSSDSGIILRPLSSVRQFVRQDVDPQTAGRQLGVDSVLEGSVQRWGDKVRVNVRLINVDNGEPLWSGTFDDKYEDIFAVQDAIAGKVADALRLRLATPHRAGQTQNVEAYRLYLQGRLFQFRSTPQEIRQAIAFYQQAIDLDPNYALAYAGMADAYRMLPITSDVAAGDAFPRSKDAALKALSLDDRSSQSHMALGYVYSWYEWNWPAAESELRKAIDLDANNPDAHRGLSILLTVTGRHDEAIDEMRTARILDPLSLPTNALEAQTLLYAGRDAEAIERLNKTFEIDPNFWIARLMLARVYISQMRWDDALIELEKARTASGGNTEATSLTVYTLSRLGREEEARKLLKDLLARSDASYSPSYNVALAYKGLGNTDEAIRWLQDAAERRDVRLILLKVDHKWDDLRTEPRFVSIVQRIGLA
jgi:serine/threonine-protein kinase